MGGPNVSCSVFRPSPALNHRRIIEPTAAVDARPAKFARRSTSLRPPIWRSMKPIAMIKLRIESRSSFFACGALVPMAVPRHAGDYFLQIEVGTWYDSRESAETLRDRWRQYGVLWPDSITFLPMAFRIEKNRTVVNANTASITQAL